MASTTQKKSTTQKSSGSSRSSASRSGTSRSKKPSQPQKRPVRREVGGVVLLVLALFAAISYFGVSAIFIDWFAALLKGLFGYGYWLAAPAMLLASLILLFHHGRPVQLRVTCALLLPVLFGSLTHMVLCKEIFESGFGILKKLWKSGLAISSGGAVSGALAEGSVAVFSRLASIIIFTVLFVVLLMVALRLTVGALIEKHRERPRYEEEPESQRPHIRVVETEPVRRRTEEPKPQIDIPLDDEPVKKTAIQAPAQKEGRFTSFFRHKSDQQKTPDQVLREKTEKKPTFTPAIPAEPAPAAEPVKSVLPAAPAEPEPPKPVRAPAPVPVQEEPASARKEKATTAKEVAAQTAAVTAEIEQKLATEEDTYQFPPITLLKASQGENHVEAGAELRNNSRRLAETLTSFGVDATPADVVHGPSVTRYEFVLDQGVKLSKITNLADDIALALGATGVRIAPIPDKSSVVGIEVPNKRVTPVLIRDVIESRDFTEHKSKTAFALGRDIGGRNVIGDIEKLPHVLIAGTTGSGKSVCTNSLIISLLYKSTPDEVRFIMVDPKMVELAPYNGIPHLLIPVVTDPKKAAGALQWAVFEMMKRYKTFSEHGVKKLEEFNRLAKASEDLEPLPSVVVVIDELADLMLVAAKEVEESICRVAQMGRAAGVHLVIATQRPSADVITGLMKANIPSRIAFAVASSLESRIILDNTGAEKLVGKGDMLYAPLGGGKPQRVQGCFISPEEIEDVVTFVKQSGEAQYSDEVIAKIEESIQEKEKGGAKGAAASAEPADEEGDELLPAAVDVVLETGQASVSMLQRRLKLGYSRAARLVDQMEERGIVGPFEGSKPRQLLITRAQWQEMQMGSAPEVEGSNEECPFPEEEV
ncbi:FtsK/SpoIIIE family DNA translocase [Dysosmobacter sp.]|uniref:FtsK/SpoIIIE family DNA translocase n=1 Tax=Dysosmobacter sp. TaxID=2591382 RepID=UPI002A9A44F0|nr:DNA translocase FtsK [Dysosmobacter sp.]MDY5612026.1 DNA translocase FtsK [Dysosmobacter sp.]